MDLQLVNKGLNFTNKKKKWVLILAAFGITGFSVYKVYNLPSVVKKRNRVLRFLTAIISLTQVFTDCNEVIGMISSDLREFLQSDSDEIPDSLKQVSKLVNSERFSDCVVRVTGALTRGVCRGCEVEPKCGISSRKEVDSGFWDRFVVRLFSDSGSGFVSVVAGSFARNIVTTLYSGEGSEKGLDLGGNESVHSPPWADVMCSDRGRDVIGECIQKFVSTAVAVYIDKTMSVNTYDELFAGLTNPKHEKQAKEMLVALCKGSIETLVKTSHQVLTNSGSGVPGKTGFDAGDLSPFLATSSTSYIVSKTYYSEIVDSRNVITVTQNGGGSSLDLGEFGKPLSGNSWVSTVSSTLAVPSNRKLVLDVTGRITFETVRSFLDFILEKVLASVKSSFDTLNGTIVERGLGVMRYVTAKSYVVASICLSLCLHLFGGSWALLPA